MAVINAVGNNLTGQTGTGAFVGSTSPTLVTPASLGVQQQDLNMNSHKITNLTAGVASTDAANVGQITSTIGINSLTYLLMGG